MKILSRLVEAPVLNVTMDDSLNVFYMREDNSIYKMPKNDRMSRSLLNNPTRRHVCDMVADTKNNLYLASLGCIDVMKTYTSYTRVYLRKSDYDIKYITVDVHNNVYVLANLGHGDHAYRVRDNELEKLPVCEEVREPFAVDSCRRIYYKNYSLDVLLKFPISRLYRENVNSVCVDKKDNAYFGTDSGLFMVEAESYEAVKVKEVNIPRIMKVGVGIDGHIYFASMDNEKGGVYTLMEVSS